MSKKGKKVAVKEGASNMNSEVKVYSLQLKEDDIIELIEPKAASLYDGLKPTIVRLWPVNGSDEPLKFKVLSSHDYLANAYVDLGDKVLVSVYAFRHDIYRRCRAATTAKGLRKEAHYNAARCKVLDLFKEIHTPLGDEVFYRCVSRDGYPLRRDDKYVSLSSFKESNIEGAIRNLVKIDRSGLYEETDIAMVSGVRFSMAEYKANTRHHADTFKICRDIHGEYWLNIVQVEEGGVDD